MSGWGEDEYNCPKCGFQLEYDDEMGWRLQVDSRRVWIKLNYCPNCGTKLKDKPNQEDKSNA